MPEDIENSGGLPRIEEALLFDSGIMTFSLPDLPYAYDALEPVIDARTMEIHHTKHHAGYTSKLNAALEGTDFAKKSIEEILREISSLPKDRQLTVRNNGGGYANHCLFREIMAPGGTRMSQGFTSLLEKHFTNVSSFKERFASEAASRFGSGRARLNVTPEGDLIIESTPNQDSPLMHGKTPILGLDVWEHAYYLHYQNRRPDYIDARWTIVNREQVEKNYAKAIT